MRRQKKGVAGIIAGVFLAAILFSSVIIFFLSITEGQSTRSRAEVEAQSYKNKKLVETFKIRSRDNLNAGYIEVQLNNTGAIPMTSSYLVVYNATTSVPILQGTPLIGGNPFVVNGGLNAVISTADVDGSITFVSNPSTDPSQFPANPSKPYKIDIISERGNIQTTTYPPPPLLEFAFSVESEFATSAAEAALAQQTGSLILNYTAFRVLFNAADYPARDNPPVDQTGWLLNIKGTPGYPAWRLPTATDLTIAVKVKNKDYSGEDLYIMHPSAMVLTRSAKGASFSQETAYICKVDESSPTFSPGPYDDSDLSEAPPFGAGVTIPNRFGNGPLPDGWPEPGWRNLYFCDINREKTKFQPVFQIASSDPPPHMTFFFFIPRGEFENRQPYAQTIPYQAVLGSESSSGFEVCLKDVASIEDCIGFAADKYQGAPGDTVQVRFFDSDGLPDYPLTVDWVDEKNTYTALGEITDSSGGITIDVQIPLNATPGEYYLIQASDAEYNTYYMTFLVT